MSHRFHTGRLTGWLKMTQ